MRYLAGVVKEYFRAHTEPQDQAGFYKVVKPLKVFKRALHARDDGEFRCIVNLEIPVGAVIYVYDLPYNYYWQLGRGFTKMRTNKARVHSIANVYDGSPVEEAYSMYDSSFYYRPRENVKPLLPFSRRKETCDSGIHFFLTLEEALCY
jgi:hypothetical protein